MTTFPIYILAQEPDTTNTCEKSKTKVTTNIFKINVTKILVPEPNFCFENIVNNNGKKIGHEFELGVVLPYFIYYYDKNIFNKYNFIIPPLNYKGFSIGYSLKFYLKNQKQYIGVSLIEKLLFVKENRVSTRDSRQYPDSYNDEIKNVLGISGSYGIMNIYKNGFALDFYWGLGVRYLYSFMKIYDSLTDYEMGKISSNKNFDYFTLALNIGVKIGYAKQYKYNKS
jgi:hypothetical protein